MIWALWCLACFLGTQVSAKCTVQIRFDLTHKTTDPIIYTLEVAQTASARATGLMYRQTLPEKGGMIFVYPEPRPVSFWMKNTLIPLDMLFFDANRKLSHLHTRAEPENLTPIFGGEAVKYVIEIAGGEVAMFGGDVQSFSWVPNAEIAQNEETCPSRY